MAKDTSKENTSKKEPKLLKNAEAKKLGKSNTKG